MSLFAAIGGVLSGIATTIGPTLATAASFLVTKLPVILETAAVCVQAISTVVTHISESLDIAPSGEKPEELGAKILQEGTRPIEGEETTQEYLDYLRNEVILDKAILEQMSNEERLNCEVVGDTLIAKSIEEKTGVELPADFLLCIPRMNLQAQTVGALIKAFSDVGIPSLNEYIRYISNDMSEAEAKITGNAVKEAIHEMAPEMSQEDIQSEIIAMKRSYNEEK